VREPSSVILSEFKDSSRSFAVT